MGWIDAIGSHGLDAFGRQSGVFRLDGECDNDYRARLRPFVRAKEDGGSAFPEPGAAQCGGMSLRDYFAAKILQGRSAIPGAIDDEYEAKLCYRLADAMLRERAK